MGFSNPPIIGIAGCYNTSWVSYLYGLHILALGGRQQLQKPASTGKWLNVSSISECVRDCYYYLKVDMFLNVQI